MKLSIRMPPLVFVVTMLASCTGSVVGAYYGVCAALAELQEDR